MTDFPDIKCPVCGSEKKTNAKYCSRNCYNKKRPPTTSKCELCKKEFVTTPSKIRRGIARFCSKKCYRQIYRGEKSTSWGGGKVEKLCLICGGKFKIPRSSHEKGIGLYCSHKCQGVASLGSKSCRWKEKKERNCVRCGTYFKFADYPSARGKATGEYCSPECYAKERAGSKNPNWKNGKTDLVLSLRTSAKYKEWRDEVYARDNYSCVKCGKDSGHDLNAHHIKPISLLLQDNNITTLLDAFSLPILWDIKNGETLCEDCHKKTHKKKWKYVKRPNRI